MWSELIAGKAALGFAAPHGLWLLGLLALILLPSFVLGARQARFYVAAALRCSAVLLLVFAVSGLSIETRENTQDVCIVVSADVSDSVGPAGERLVADLTRGLVAAMRPSDRLGAVAFARHGEVVAWPASPPRPAPIAATGIDPSATRLASGIEVAIPLCPEDSEKKIVLVTDGNETLGDARSAAALARDTGARLYAEVPGSGRGGGLSFEKLIVPPLVRAGSMFPLRAMVRNGFSRATGGTLDVLVNGEPAVHQTVHLDPGINVFEVPYQLHERGSYQLSARVVGEDAAEDHRQASLAVAGPIRALVVTRSRDSALSRALRLREVDVEFGDPTSFPTLEDLLQYHCVILDDVPRKELSDAALEALESYVRNFGGGFLMTGGARSFGDKAYQKSPVERVLPVSFVEQEPKAKGRVPMGVFLLVDRSNSMAENSRNPMMRDGEKIRYVRQAALALVQQLRPEDRVGVIAFDSDPYVLGPLRPLSEQRAVLQERIERLLPGGGTDFKTALEIATAQLAQSGLKTLHIILLTDGDTNRGAPDHLAVIQAMARLGITVTTIRIGSDEVNLEFLERISRDTGGRFYHVEDIETLPQLIVTEGQQNAGEPGHEGESPAAQARSAEESQRPAIGEVTEVIRGLAAKEFPLVRSLPPTKLKPGADLVLYLSDENHKQPLLATWQYGLGRAAAFPFDATQPDAVAWAAWSGFAKLWSQLVRWAIREETAWETRQSVRIHDGALSLEVQTFDDSAEGNISAQVFTSAQSSVDLALTPVAPRLYRAPLPPLPPGKYALLLTRHTKDRAAAQKREVLNVEASSGEAGSPELARKLPDLDLLREITAQTGGAVNPSIEELTARRGASRVVRHGLDGALLLLALALLLSDMALRLRQGG